ncbi:MAG: HPP family protein [Thermodesulfobacteriota bacterium]
MIAANIMSTDIVTVRSGDTLEKSLTLMSENSVREIAVVDDEGMVVGLLTPDVILKKTVVEKSGENSPKSRELQPFNRRLLDNLQCLSAMDVCDAMARDVVKVGPEISTDEVSKILLTPEKGVTCVAVVDDRGALLGIIRPLDVVRRLWEHVD